MMKNKVPMQAQLSNMELCPNFSDLDRLCPIEFMLISQIIPFVFIVAKTKGGQHGLKGQCVSVPTDFETILLTSCDEEYLIFLALKRRLTDKKVVNKQPIRSVLVNTALQKLRKINPFYSNITIHNELEGLSEQSDLILWKLLTDKNPEEPNNRDQTDSDGDEEGSNKFKEGEFNESSSAFPSVMYNLDRPNISPSEIINIAP